MKIPITLLAATVLIMVLGAVTVLAKEPNAAQDTDTTEKAQLDAGTPEPVTLDNVWEASPEGMSLEDRLTKAILRSRTVKGETREFYWERCGIPVPEDQLIPQAKEWVDAFLGALTQVEEQTSVRLPVWGAFATMANEGGINECGLNYEARKWASEHICKVRITETWHGKTAKRKVTKKLVDKFQQTYARDTVWSIITSPDYKDARIQVRQKDGSLRWKSLGNKFDGGAWQIRYSMKNMTRNRFDQITGFPSGIYMGAQEMARRALAYGRRFRTNTPHPRPWMLWPGWNPNSVAGLAYDTKITSIARWLGARKSEIERGFLIAENPTPRSSAL